MHGGASSSLQARTFGRARRGGCVRGFGGGWKGEEEARGVAGVTHEDLRGYPDYKKGYKRLISILSKYCNTYDKADKIKLVGFNNRHFDDDFFRKFFLFNDDKYFGSWFWSDSLDVMVLASEYLEDLRSEMSSFKLFRVAKTLGLEVDKKKLHDAGYDVELTREIYRIVTGREL